jgi:autoinducer 2-degrading protein
LHVTLVNFLVKPDQVAAFIAATRRNHEASRREPGNRRFDVLQSAADPAHLVLCEAYACMEDAVAHKHTAHYAAWRDAVADMMAEPRQGIPFVGLFPT